MMEYLNASPYGRMHRFTDISDMMEHFKTRKALELKIIEEILGECAVILPAKAYKIEDLDRYA